MQSLSIIIKFQICERTSFVCRCPWALGPGQGRIAGIYIVCRAGRTGAGDEMMGLQYAINYAGLKLG